MSSKTAQVAPISSGLARISFPCVVSLDGKGKILWVTDARVGPHTQNMNMKSTCFYAFQI